MHVQVISLFPEMFSALSTLGVTGRAHAQGIWHLHTHNPRDFTYNVHHTVDDRPYGGGPGMVMMAQPLLDALNSAIAQQAGFLQEEEKQAVSEPATATKSGSAYPVILMSPTGKRFDQAMAQQLAQTAGVVLVCGRYEGIDQRFIDQCVDDEISIGDYVLSGGELAAMSVLDATIRLLPKVLHDQESALQDSFNTALTGLLDSPHYTRPETFRGQDVPAVLKSGNHALIAQWRREQSLRLSALRRPDLLEKAKTHGWLNARDWAFLDSLKKADE